MSNGETEKAERNRRSFARLSKALPAIFPPAVLARAVSRPFIPPTPRLAIESYWRAHPIRADRLARALAARTGSPFGWTWRISQSRKTGLATTERRRLLTESVPTAWVLGFAAYAVNQCIGSAGIRICGTPDRIRMRYGIVLALWPGSSGMRRKARPHCYAGSNSGVAVKQA